MGALSRDADRPCLSVHTARVPASQPVPHACARAGTGQGTSALESGRAPLVLPWKRDPAARVNTFATVMVRQYLQPDDVIVGDAILCTLAEAGEGENADV